MVGIILIIILGFMLTLPKTSSKSKTNKIPESHSVNTLQNIQKRNKINILTHNNSTSYFVYKGQPMGFHYDLVKAFAKSKDWDFEIIVEEDLQKALEMLNDGKGDLVAMDITHTKTREKTIQFTESIGFNRQVLVQRKKYSRKKSDTADYIKTVMDLENKQIYVQKGTIFINNLKHLQDMSATDFDIVIDTIHTMEELVLMVANGQIDYTACDERIAKANATYDSKIDYSMCLSTQQRLAWAIPKGADSLLYEINLWLKEFKKTRKYAILNSKYYKTKKKSFYTDQEFLPLRGGGISPYDDIIKKYAKELDWDWRLLAAVINQESRFNAEANSWAGANGLMQLMPAAAKKFGLEDPFNPEENIKAGVKYLKYLLGKFDEPEISKTEQIKFALASYNVGMGHIIDARKLAQKNNQNPNQWTQSVDTFIILKSNPKYYNDPDVKYGYCHGKETYAYVEKIFAFYANYVNVVN